jgi:hypothetical protein
MHENKKEAAVMEYKLACENDLEKLGIKDERGKRDIEKLIQHIDSCKKCRDYYTALLLGSGFVSM